MTRCGRSVHERRPCGGRQEQPGTGRCAGVAGRGSLWTDTSELLSGVVVTVLSPGCTYGQVGRTATCLWRGAGDEGRVFLWGCIRRGSTGRNLPQLRCPSRDLSDGRDRVERPRGRLQRGAERHPRSAGGGMTWPAQTGRLRRIARLCVHTSNKAERAPMPESIALAQLKGLLADGVQLVHVLPPEEYAAEHLPGAVNVPLKQLDAESGTTGGGPGPGHDACAGRSAPRCPHVAGRSWQQTSRASRGSPRATGGLAVSRTRPRDLRKDHTMSASATRTAVPLSPPSDGPR